MLWQPTLVTLSLLSLASAGVIPRQEPSYPPAMSPGKAAPASEATAEVSAPMAGEEAAPMTTMAEGGMAAETAAPAATMTQGGCGYGACPPAETTAAAEPYAPPPAEYEPPPMAYETTTTAAAYASPTYGSGSANWNEYQSCVQICQAKFGGGGEMMPPPPPPTATQPPSAGQASKTHTVIVAPTKGVLRYVPFAIKINPGDEIEYVWGAGPHTVTESSIGGICNKSDGGFTSGLRNASATFTEAFNDTSTRFAYCTVPTHCQKGMFSIINPPEVPAGSSSNSSLSMMLPGMLEGSPSLNASYEMAKKTCGNNSVAWEWMSNMDMAGMEDWSMAPAVENLLYTRMAFALNPSAIVDGFSSLENYVQPPAFGDLTASGYGSAGYGTPTSATVSASASAVASVSPGSGAEGAAAAGATASAEKKASGSARSTKVPLSLLVVVLSIVSSLILA